MYKKAWELEDDKDYEIVACDGIDNIYKSFVYRIKYGKLIVYNEETNDYSLFDDLSYNDMSDVRFKKIIGGNKEKTPDF
ncbi:MAG TPA: hypothetical protein GXZ90_03110 [Clostridiales bacterium]|nr:hypothetical protein [Clostridiales bacterium]